LVDSETLFVSDGLSAHKVLKLPLDIPGTESDKLLSLDLEIVDSDDSKIEEFGVDRFRVLVGIGEEGRLKSLMRFT
jgi:hypothetical protein